MNSILASFLLIISVALIQSAVPSSEDDDLDGIPNELEQQLLQRFVPQFFLSAQECDGSPAEFHSGSAEPRPKNKNGTVYGQVFPASREAGAGSFIEIHYYHLWGRDCGMNGHALDAEHVSALLFAETEARNLESWRAVYWYAAAHEDTICDASHAARSSFLDAEHQGPKVWISAGKHSSFLGLELCRGGCSGGDCADMRAMSVAAIINIGERDAPMNGAVWIGSPAWPLASKMQTDFTETVLRKLNTAEGPGIIAVNEAQAPVKAVVRAGSSGAGALSTADQKTGAALSTAAGATGKSIENSNRSVGNSLKGAFRALWKALTGSPGKKK